MSILIVLFKQCKSYRLCFSVYCAYNILDDQQKCCYNVKDMNTFSTIIKSIIKNVTSDRYATAVGYILVVENEPITLFP